MIAVPAPESSLARPLLLVGVVLVALAVAGTAALNAHALVLGAVPEGMTLRHVPVFVALRAAFLVLSLGAAFALVGRLPARFRITALAAAGMLAFSVVGDGVTALRELGVVAGVAPHLGPLDDVHHRLFRLASMASRAVPLLALLAALEHALLPDPAPCSGSKIAELLVRFEPVLFAIGASTLATLLAAGALIHKELTWLLPIGADTTLAGCAAAAIRARRRGDRVSFGAWTTVAASMGVGLLMGGYSFGGPFPTPAAVGPYDALARMVLRDAHIMAIAGGIGVLAFAAARRTRQTTRSTP